MRRIVHLGLGNFHRAHQAWYTANAGGWKITGVVMSNAALKAQLDEHNNDYVLGTWGSKGLTIERISIYDEVLLATEESALVVAKITDPNTHVVTLTITEKGYQLKPEDNRPITAMGMLAAGLVQRCKKTNQPLTVISCDNMSENGRKLRQAMVDCITELEPNVLPWLLDNVSFPNTMIDRITPKLSASAQKEIADLTDVQGVSTVGTEAFSEWIIENNFKSQRPNWDQVGALLVSDVSSYEERKLRFLNASHSYLAYAGLLAGHTFVHEAISDSELESNVNAIWDEAEWSVSEPASTTLQAYRSALLDRFADAHMRHSLEQIAMDGSLKLRERIVPILQKRQSEGLASPKTFETISVWAKFVQARVNNGGKLNDPNAEQLVKIVKEHPSDATTRLIEMILKPV